MNSKTYKLPNGKKAVFEYDITGVGKITLECMDELMDMIADRPQEWIPCSERLPDNGHYYLWCSDMGHVQSDYYWNGFEDGQRYGYNIVAWMPLPKPYGERKESE